jgi:hypothetical protein
MRGSHRIGLLIVFALAGVRASAQAPIPVVHTWGDLQNAPKLTVVPVHDDPQKTLPVPTKPVTFQVGFASSETTTGGAAVLYFLGETGSKNPYTPEEWGVYWLQLDGQPWEHGWTYNLTFQPGYEPSGTLFYAEAINIPTPGDHVVELVKTYAEDAKPVVLARATIHVRDDPDSFWYPLWTTQDMSSGAARSPNTDGTYYAIEPVRNPKGDAAVPSPPRPRWYTGFPAPNIALPGLIPADSSGSQVQLRMTDSTLIVTFDPKIEGFFPDDYFLTRWWVNGKQVALDPKARAPGQSRMLGMEKPVPTVKEVTFHVLDRLALLNVGAQTWYTQEVHFNLDFKPEWIGAKQGDRVGVQFLYCPNHFIRIQLYAAMMQPESAFSQASFSEMSNRVEFIYSGDPKHPQR